jgi:mercuric ion transport protein
MSVQVKSDKSWIAGVLAALTTSLCCITPVLALVGGVGSAASSFGWIEPYRSYLIAATVLFFSFAWYQKLKLQKEVNCNCETDNRKSFFQSKLFLGIITIVAALLISFPYYAKLFYTTAQKSNVIIVDKSNIQMIQLNISGMDCEACTNPINIKLSKLNGVIEYSTSYENANSMIRFDNSKTNIDSIVAAVNATGYKVIDVTTKN